MGCQCLSSLSSVFFHIMILAFWVKLIFRVYVMISMQVLAAAWATRRVMNTCPTHWSLCFPWDWHLLAFLFPWFSLRVWLPLPLRCTAGRGTPLTTCSNIGVSRRLFLHFLKPLSGILLAATADSFVLCYCHPGALQGHSGNSFVSQLCSRLCFLCVTHASSLVCCLLVCLPVVFEWGAG